MKNGNSKFDRNFKIAMYIAMAISSILVLFPFVFSYLTTIEIYGENEIDIYNGVTDLSAYDLDSVRPFDLNGEWITYEGVYFDGETADYDELGEGTLTTFPIRDLDEVTGTKTYQLYIKMDLEEEEIESAVLSIPFPTDSIRVYVNEVYVEGHFALESWSGFDSAEKVYYLADAYDSSLEYQVIMISVNENALDTELYNREISISSLVNIVAMAKIALLVEGMLVAMMAFSIIVGILYILLLPTYSVLTFLNLFDTALMLHIFFNMCALPKIILDTASWGTVGDVMFRRLDMFFFFLAGLLGNILAQLLFDEEGYYNKFFLHVINGGFIALMLVFAWRPELMNVWGIRAAIVVIGFTFLGIVVKFMRSCKLGRIGPYKWLHMIKTVWVGVIIFVDIVTLNSSNRPEPFLIISYTLFFLLHVIIRAIEYRAPYIKVVEINDNLERLVESRTKELRETNDVLRKISIVDPLTTAYNRMFFEEEFMKVIDDFNSPATNIMSIHVCMLDLDNFKAINDTYGHQEGDNQLVLLIKCARTCVKEDVIISRIGGEEFTILFIDYTDEYVLQTVDSIRVKLEKESHISGRTTGSFGIAKAHQGITRKEFLSQVDKCLYYAKGNGKNQVVHNFYGEMKKYDK